MKESGGDGIFLGALKGTAAGLFPGKDDGKGIM
jgi:hypothetical protein